MQLQGGTKVPRLDSLLVWRVTIVLCQGLVEDMSEAFS